jgi:hypothetical protein
MKTAEDALMKAFLGWQCRLRQLSVRNDEGRPSPGMRPTLRVAGQNASEITVVIIKRDSDRWTSEFQHIFKRTHDPKERFEAALRYLQSSYYQEPLSFDDRLTAVFGMTATVPKQIAGRTDCMLVFEQFRQTFELPCKADRLEVEDPSFQATYWHNALFNPAMPAGVQIVSFHPDWSRAEADPPAQ